jgi:TetR/AcrR family transcriptional repressor of lmrAB and yxaGH operons
MIQSAAVLMRERGVDATSFSDVVVSSGAPRGSIYHYFPRGKAQLFEEATRFGGDYVAAELAASLEKGDAIGALRHLTGLFREILIASDYEAGCPVVAAALEGRRSPEARNAAGQAFGHWLRLIADALVRDGLAADRAASLATLAVSAIEGAIVVCRAQRSPEPLDRALEQLEALFRAQAAS